jgi:hypothetical protein
MSKKRSRIEGMRMPFVVTVAMSAALANCGGTVIGGEDEPGSGGSAGSGGDDPGGTGGIGGDGGYVSSGGGGNPPYPGTGGYVGTGGASAGGAGGYYPGTGGFGANPPAPPTAICPTPEPSTGQWCSYTGPACTYGDCYGTPTVYATCVNGAWQVSQASCNPPPYQCPEEEPPIGNACMPIGAACAYSFGGCNGEDGWYEIHERVLQCTVDGWQITQELVTSCGDADAGGDGGGAD